MKKVLFATTALVASAGVAAADDNLNISIGGSAEMGIVGGSDQETQFHNDVDISFGLAAETGTGLSFGAVVDLDEAGNLGRALDNQGTRVFISGGAIMQNAPVFFGEWTLQQSCTFTPRQGTACTEPTSAEELPASRKATLVQARVAVTLGEVREGVSLSAQFYVHAAGDEVLRRTNSFGGELSLRVSFL